MDRFTGYPQGNFYGPVSHRTHSKCLHPGVGAIEAVYPGRVGSCSVEAIFNRNARPGYGSSSIILHFTGDLCL